MLWFDNDSQLNVADKVNKAAAYSQSKYQQTPNQCFVHPSMIYQDTGRRYYDLLKQYHPSASFLDWHCCSRSI